MAVQLGKAMIEVRVDDSRLRPGLQKAKVATQQATTSMTRSFSKVNDSVGILSRRLLAAVAAYASFRAITGGLRGFVQAASDAAETQNKFEVAFRDMRFEAEKSINVFSKAAGGLNDFRLKEAASGFKLLLNAMETDSKAATEMSTSLASLAYDIASLYNTSIDEAMTRLKSGLVGETEAVRRYGIDVSEAAVKQEAMRQGIGKSVETMSQGEKVLLRYRMIMKQSKDAQGDLNRTQDQAANVGRRLREQWEKLKIVMGQAILPMFVALGRKILDVMKNIDIREVIGRVLKEYYRFYNALKPGFEFLKSAAIDFVNTLREMGPGLRNALVEAGTLLDKGILYTLGGIVKVATWVIRALQGVGKAFVWVADTATKVAARLGEILPGDDMFGRWAKSMQTSLAAMKRGLGDLGDTKLPKALEDFLSGKVFDESSLANTPLKFAQDLSEQYRTLAQEIWSVLEAKKADAQADREKRMAKIGFVNGSELWSKASIQGMQEQFLGSPWASTSGRYSTARHLSLGIVHAGGVGYGFTDNTLARKAKFVLSERSAQDKLKNSTIEQLIGVLQNMPPELVEAFKQTSVPYTEGAY